MLRVTLTDLSRLPPERLAKLLLEWAARDRTLLSRLHGTIADAAQPTGPDIAAAAEHRAPSEPTGDASLKVELVGGSPSMRQLAGMIDRFAKTDEPVLITGESGTGKELAARSIHQRSARAGGPFAAVNCAAIPPALIASELFGYEKGAFTGAMARAKGQVEHAHGGTLFLDEIGDMPVELQGYLLRFLQEGQITRVGGRETIQVNVRIVAATNVRLRQAIAEGRFREDLFYRLNVLSLEVPPLRERPEDIAPLANHFLREAAIQFRREVTGFEPEALAVLHQYHWPGNVRELMSAVRRAVVIGGTPIIARSDLVGLEAWHPGQPTMAVPTAISVPGLANPRPPPGSPEERALLLGVLTETRENIALTARQLGVSRVTLYRMLRRHAIVPSRGFNVPPGTPPVVPSGGAIPGGLPEAPLGGAGPETDGGARHEHVIASPAR
jgi:transcriptional regulator with PAS, ATPase and Fis domain